MFQAFKQRLGLGNNNNYEQLSEDQAIDKAGDAHIEPLGQKAPKAKKPKRTVAKLEAKPGNHKPRIKTLMWDKEDAARFKINKEGCQQVRFEEYETAEQTFRELLNMSYNNAAVNNNLACAIMHQGRYIDALPYLQAAIALRPDDPAINCNYASCLAKTGKKNEAEGRWRELMEKFPQSYTAKRDLGLYYYDNNRKGKARKTLIQAMNTKFKHKEELDAILEHCKKKRAVEQAAK